METPVDKFRHIHPTGGPWRYHGPVAQEIGPSFTATSAAGGVASGSIIGTSDTAPATTGPGILDLTQATEKAGLTWAKLMADGKARGRPRSALDMIIAAIAETNGCIVVTDNEKDFEGVDILNPIRPVARK